MNLKFIEIWYLEKHQYQYASLLRQGPTRWRIYDVQQVKLEKIEFEEIIFIYSFKICQASDIFCILYIFLIILQMHWKGIYCIADKNNNDKDHEDEDDDKVN